MRAVHGRAGERVTLSFTLRVVLAENTIVTAQGPADAMFKSYPSRSVRSRKLISGASETRPSKRRRRWRPR